jgi:curved DNA-binding protein CbpA
MIASHGGGEITFYEELGIAPNASPEEVRDAFRLFVRLLHPDQQTDPQLKEIAENQMRKLNRVYAVLSDPESRREYDEALEEEHLLPIIVNSPSPGRRVSGATLTWTAAIAVSAGVLIWLLASDNSSPVPTRASEPGSTLITASAPASPVKPQADRDSDASQVSRLRTDLRAVMAERDAAIAELDKLRGALQIRPRETQQTGGSRLLESAEPQPLTLTELPAAPKLPFLASPTLPRVERPVNRQMAGFWFYAKPPDGQNNKNQTLYPPEYIEATITEEGGVIHGRYRSRFLIVDRAISPEVNFTFTGPRNGMQCNCQWTGAGGAKGELTLRLTSDNSMRIDWSASDLGTQQGLISGTAVLTRRIE